MTYHGLYENVEVDVFGIWPSSLGREWFWMILILSFVQIQNATSKNCTGNGISSDVVGIRTEPSLSLDCSGQGLSRIRPLDKSKIGKAKSRTQLQRLPENNKRTPHKTSAERTWGSSVWQNLWTRSQCRFSMMSHQLSNRPMKSAKLHYYYRYPSLIKFVFIPIFVELLHVSPIFTTAQPPATPATPARPRFGAVKDQEDFFCTRTIGLSWKGMGNSWKFASFSRKVGVQQSWGSLGPSSAWTIDPSPCWSTVKPASSGILHVWWNSPRSTLLLTFKTLPLAIFKPRIFFLSSPVFFP